jgi:aminoglycoside phosphotransferase (APT) family kinase protein
VTESNRIPRLAVSLAAAALGAQDAIRWWRLRGGDTNRTWRVAAGDSGGRTAIVKWSRLPASDAATSSREALAYAEVLDDLGVRTPALLGSDADGESICIVIEDLSGVFQFPAGDHRWTRAELPAVIRAYAWLHAEGAGVGHRPWMLGYQSPDWTPESVVGDARELHRRGEWGVLGGLGRLADRAQRDLAVLDGMSSVLHLDCDPSNAGFGITDPGEVALIDWEMAGWGAPELDLAYLHLHPFEPAASVARDRLLEFYWSERARWGPVPSDGDRQSRQRVADRVFGLALVSIARRSLDAPHPPGGRADRYWKAMRPVLFRRLEALVVE